MRVFVYYDEPTANPCHHACDVILSMIDVSVLVLIYSMQSQTFDSCDVIISIVLMLVFFYYNY